MRIISGVKPTGDITIGHYLGVMKRWAEIGRSDHNECFYFIPNLHALNMRPDPVELSRLTWSATAWLLTIGIDPQKSVVFKQSDVSAHSELMCILNNYTTVGELSRMTQYKDKAVKNGAEGLLVGLFNYPVLMAADILLYDVEEVPVGHDQVQHVELTRDIATRFNNLHGDVFVVPKATIQDRGSRILDLQNPDKKMSKSDSDLSGCVLLADNEETIRRKFMRAVTDSGNQVRTGDDKVALTNLINIFSLLSDIDVEQVELNYAGKGYGDFKRDLADLAVEKIVPLQHKYDEYIANGQVIRATLEKGREVAEKIATAKISTVKETIGIN